MANEGTIDVSTLVQTSGDQTISGTKTCSSLVMLESPDESDSSTNVATTAYVNAATSVVHTTGAETIDGEKTFTSNITQVQSTSDNGVILKDTGLESNSTVPSSDHLRYYRVLANDGTIIGDFRVTSNTDGECSTSLFARKTIDSTTRNAIVSAVVSPTGEIYATCPTPSSATDSSTKIATTAWVNTIGNSVVHIAGTETITGNKTFTETINGEALYARWGDLAEMYEADASYKPGTLLQFGGKAEMTISVSEVNGIVSTKPGLLINNDIKNKVGIPLPIALIGKVPVRVIGELKKFDRIALSDIPGVATKKTLQEHAIGVCLEDKPDEDEGLVLCSVKLMF